MYIYRHTVEYHETDMAGIVHFSRFFCYMENAEHAFLRSLGLSVVLDMGDRRIAWPRVSCAFDFKKPLQFEDVFEVQLSVEKIGDKSVTYHADIVCEGDLMANGSSTSVCCELKEGEDLRSITIPDVVRAKLEGAIAGGDK
jgi:4-hydroxybenzoyl-CoA thioesterase/acyl-CoA thioester hydrolase